MGASSSKEEVDESGFINDPRYITWDQHGNLIYGMAHPVSRKQQLKEILELDFIDEEEGKQWYVVSSAWVASWLAYVHFAKTVAPCPGPCDNNFDYTEEKWRGRFGLVMAKGEKTGDYRRVSKDVWRKFQKEHKRETGEFDPALWVIEDPPLPPDVTAKKKKNRGKKQKELQDKEPRPLRVKPQQTRPRLFFAPPRERLVSDSSKPRNSSVLEVGGEEDVVKKRES
eukprot:gene31136-37632_t